MLVHFDKGRLVSKSHHIDQLIVYQSPKILAINFTAGLENGMASIEEYRDKRFIVERTTSKVDCKSSEVKGLKVIACNGNIQVKNFAN